MKRTVAGIYSAAHFFVDLSCAVVMLKFAYNGDPSVILVYNFCAFALQMPFGIVLDRFGGARSAAAAGCGLIALSCFFCMLPFFRTGMTAAVISGIGNALFHTGGGIYMLNEFEGASALGVFVSPGAIGLYMGICLSAEESGTAAVLPILSMAVFAAALSAVPHIFKENIPDRYGKDPFSAPLPLNDKAAAAMLFAVVVIRSFGGFAVSFSWKTAGAASLAAVIVTASGKAAGGFLSDKYGMKRTAAATMLLSAVLYIFSDNIAAGLAAVLLFNMSMPITLKGAADIFGDAKGFSFGLLTFALFLGYIPSYAGNTGASHGAMSALCVISAVLLTACFKLCRKEDVLS
ncbi:MAG: hypothetical protein NC120_00275 [Ruminococcus sp.]|nr:hypothetical protein [Ruminococcus sp.]